jgi:hypothetical protein
MRLAMCVCGFLQVYPCTHNLCLEMPHDVGHKNILHAAGNHDVAQAFMPTDT